VSFERYASVPAVSLHAVPECVHLHARLAAVRSEWFVVVAAPGRGWAAAGDRRVEPQLGQADAQWQRKPAIAPWVD
jgi:hypothetical protein